MPETETLKSQFTEGIVLNANHNYATTPVAQPNLLVYLEEKMKKWKLLKKKLGREPLKLYPHGSALPSHHRKSCNF